MREYKLGAYVKQQTRDTPGCDYYTDYYKTQHEYYLHISLSALTHYHMYPYEACLFKSATVDRFLNEAPQKKM